MKYKILFVVLIFLFACKRENQNQLLGSWKMKNVENYTGQDVKDRMTFFANDSLLIEVFADKKLVTKIKSKYLFDKKAKTLEIRTGSYIVKYNVLKLDDDELDLFESKTKTLIKNVRID